MLTKAVMIIWLGIAQTQTMAISDFDSMADCEAAKEAMAKSYNGWSEGGIQDARCIPYISND